ncbi:MAG TPA: NUDIX hydrolase [Candidatus Pacearchaeota archaeon]|nr:nucleoside triphosphatase NudI [archaeon BMS3Abin17]HDK42002.1 NUDIX hydrolase [Candidatus Pacearchaeota archaeon]HDZ60074.1 NUDIX hydrolase [Candidatus Pacearchaeota archaeon]
MTFINLLAKVFKHKYVMAGAPAIIINSDKRILLGKRDGKIGIYPNLWGLPGGMIEYGEDIGKAIKRELKEELGVDSGIIKKSNNIYENLPNKECNIHTIDIPYYCKIKGIPKPRDETSEVKWFEPSEIKKMKLAYSHKAILKGEGLI